MNSAYFYSVFSRGRFDTWWQRLWFLFCLLFQRWATRNLPLEPPRPFLYTQRSRTMLEISIARRYLKWNRHLHSILLTARRKGGSCESKLGSTLLLFRNFKRKERHTRRLFFFAPSGRAPWKINAFQFTASEDSNKVDTIIAKFDQHFTGDVNETYERFKFNQRNEEAGENLDAYLTALRNMTDIGNFCTCPTMKDSLIRDRIVLQKRKLHLKRCIDICWTSESATTHMQEIDGKLEEVHWINKAKGPPKTSGRWSDRPEHLPDRSSSQSRKLKCKFC